MTVQRKKIAVIQLARFGDLIQTSPLLQNLKKQESVTTTLVIDKKSQEAADLLGDVDEILVVDLQEAVNLFRHDLGKAGKNLFDWSKPLRELKPFDELILLNQGGIPSAIAAFIPAMKKQGPFFGKPLPPPHAYLNNALQYRSMNTIHLSEIWAAYGPGIFPLSEPKLKQNLRGTSFAFLSDENASNPYGKRVFALNIGAGAANRRLRSEIVADLVNILLIRGDAVVILLGLREDKITADKVLNRLSPNQKHSVIDLCGKTTLWDLVEILDNADVLISSDTGTLQLAAATSVKSLGLFFSGANPVETGPFKSGSIAIADENHQGIKEDDRVIHNLMMPVNKLADLAWDMANNKTIDGWNDETTFSVYVARSTPMGPNYRPERKSCEEPLSAGERWSNLARRLIWSGNDTELPEKNAGIAQSTIGSNLDYRSKRLILKSLEYNRKKLSSLNDEFQNLEEKWIISLMDTFPHRKNSIETILVEMMQQQKLEVPRERVFA